VNGVKEHNHLAMAPFLDDSRLQTKITALLHQVVDLRALNGELIAIQDTRTAILQQKLAETKLSTKALEEVVKKQASLSKALEVRINKLELSQPPPYAKMSALFKEPNKKK
jgi:hypothetical protein